MATWTLRNYCASTAGTNKILGLPKGDCMLSGVTVVIRRLHHLRITGAIAIYQQLCCWLKVGKFREGLSNLLFEAQPLRVISQGCDLLCDMRLATLNLDCIVQKVLYTYRRPAEQAAIPLGTNPLKKRLQESWIAAESVSSHSA